MVYCGSGTETPFFLIIKKIYSILWSTAEAVLRLLVFFINKKKLILWSTAEAVLRLKNQRTV